MSANSIQNLGELVDQIVGLAEKRLVRDGCLHPFGALVGSHSQLVEPKQPEEDETALIEKLRNVMRQRAGRQQVDAAVVVFETMGQHAETGHDMRAIVVEIDCRGGPSLIFYYLFTLEDGQLQREDVPFQKKGEHFIFQAEED